MHIPLWSVSAVMELEKARHQCWQHVRGQGRWCSKHTLVDMGRGVDLTCFVHTVGIFLDACFTDCDPGHAWIFTSKLAEASKFWGSYLKVSVHKLDGVNS